MCLIDFQTHPIPFRSGGTPLEIVRLVRHRKSLGIERMIVLGDVLFGSTAPLLSVAAQSAKISDAQLPPESAALVAQENVRRFFSL